MKTKSLLLLVMLLIVATFTLASCDAVSGVMDSVGNVVDGVVDKVGDLPFIGDLPFFDDEETTTAPVTTTAPEPPVTTTAPEPPVTTTAPEPPVTTTAPEPPTPVDPLADVALADDEVTYDGEAKTLAVTGAPDGATVEYSIDGADPVSAVSIVNAGTYTVTATVSLDGKSVVKTATLKINKQKVTLADLEAAYAAGSGVYTGSALTHEAASFDIEKLTVAYSYSGDMINVGPYKATATFALTAAYGANYELTGDKALTVDFEITQADFDFGALTLDDGTSVYGDAVNYKATGIPDGVDATYVIKNKSGQVVTEIVDADTYYITATFTPKNTNYKKIVKTATYTVTKKQVSIDGLALAWNTEGATEFKYGYAFLESEAGHQMVLTAASVALLEENGLTVSYKTVKHPDTSFGKDDDMTAPLTEAGDYKTTATFAAANANYEFVGENTMSIEWGIYTEEEGVWSPLIK